MNCNAYIVEWNWHSNSVSTVGLKLWVVTFIHRWLGMACYSKRPSAAHWVGDQLMGYECGELWKQSMTMQAVVEKEVLHKAFLLLYYVPWKSELVVQWSWWSCSGTSLSFCGSMLKLAPLTEMNASSHDTLIEFAVSVDKVLSFWSTHSCFA